MLQSVSRYHQGCCKAFKHYKKIWKKDSAFRKVQILFRTLWTNEQVINNYERDLRHSFSAYAKFSGKTNISYPQGVKMICFWKKVVYVPSEWFLADFRSFRAQFFENGSSKICVRCFCFFLIIVIWYVRIFKGCVPKNFTLSTLEDFVSSIEMR